MIGMSGWISKIDNWDRQGLDWQYIDQATMRIFGIPANTQFQLPVEDHTFNFPEGVLLQFMGTFDHPTCGIRMESDPEFDTDIIFTVNNAAMSGLARSDILVQALIPPATPAGMYSIRVMSPWTWKKWLRLYLINTDSVPHRVLAHAYHIVVLKEERPKE